MAVENVLMPIAERFVGPFAWRYGRIVLSVDPAISRDDLLQEGYLAVLRAAAKTRGTAIAVPNRFVFWALRNHYGHLTKKWARRGELWHRNFARVPLRALFRQRPLGLEALPWYSELAEDARRALKDFWGDARGLPRALADDVRRVYCATTYEVRPSSLRDAVKTWSPGSEQDRHRGDMT